jgi:molybdate transport system substrate-binding protein
MGRYLGLTLRVLGRGTPAIGPGKAELIERIAQTGSISAAARAMGMSYRRAWQPVEALNRSFVEPVIVTATGGKRGGGANLMRAMLLAVLCFWCLSGARAQGVPVVAGAADLKFALEEIASAFRAQSGRDLRLSFGSSGNITRQLEQGAPFQMFLSADESFVFRIADKGLTLDRGTLYAVGRIVLMAPHGSDLAVDGRLDGLRRALAGGRIKRFAIANPDHAPYGRAAREALQHARLWDSVQPALVLGENVSQAAQFATGGSAQGGIIAYSLALAPAVSRLGRFELIPADWHQPLRQRMVLMKTAGETARAFYSYVQTKHAREIFIRYGFVLPGEAK